MQARSEKRAPFLTLLRVKHDPGVRCSTRLRQFTCDQPRTRSYEVKAPGDYLEYRILVRSVSNARRADRHCLQLAEVGRQQMLIKMVEKLERRELQAGRHAGAQPLENRSARLRREPALRRNSAEQLDGVRSHHLRREVRVEERVEARLKVPDVHLADPVEPVCSFFHPERECAGTTIVDVQALKLGVGRCVFWRVANLSLARDEELKQREQCRGELGEALRDQLSGMGGAR